MNRFWIALLPGFLMAALPALAQDPSPPRIVSLRPGGSGPSIDFAYLLAAHLERELAGSYEISVTDAPEGRGSLSGAMDVISAIADLSGTDQSYYLGLTQADVAYYFQEGGHPLYVTSHVHRDAVVALAWVYSEYLHIYSAVPELCQHGVRSLSSHVGEWERFLQGALGSGTLITATNILNMLDERGSLQAHRGAGAIRWEFVSSEGSGAAWAENLSGWGATVVSGVPDPDLRSRLAAGEGCLVDLSAPQRRHVANIYSRFYRVDTVSDYEDDRGEEIAVQMVEVPALLVASKHLPSEPAEAIARFFRGIDEGSWVADRPLAGRTSGPSLRALVSRAAALFGEASPSEEASRSLFEAMSRHAGSARRADLVLRSHRSMIDLRKPGIGWEFWIAFASLAAASWLFRQVVRRWRREGFFEVPLRLMLPAVVIGGLFWIHGSLWVVQVLEYREYMSYRTDALSPFITYSYPDLVPKLIHHVATAFTADELFPVSREAQLVWLTIPLVTIGHLIWGVTRVLVPFATTWLKRHLKGGSLMKLENHTVICNWHDHASDVIRQLYIQNVMSGHSNREIVVVCAEPEAIDLPRMMNVKENRDLGEHFVHGIALRNDDNDEFGGLKPVYVFEGDPAKAATIKRMRVGKAENVIVFPNAALDEPDSSTPITVLNVQQRLKDRAAGDGHRTKVVVWCADPENVPVFQNEGFDLDDVCSAEWAWRVICQATQVPHVSNIYRRLMTSSTDTNEFYELRLPTDWRTCAFFEIQDWLRAFNLNDAAELEGHDDQKNTVMLIAYCEKDDLRRERIHINPDPRALIHAGDLLFVLTYSCSERRRKKLMRMLAERNRENAPREPAADAT